MFLALMLLETAGFARIMIRDPEFIRLVDNEAPGESREIHDAVERGAGQMASVPLAPAMP
jgi:hypothetical protein